MKTNLPLLEVRPIYLWKKEKIKITWKNKMRKRNKNIWKQLTGPGSPAGPPAGPG